MKVTGAENGAVAGGSAVSLTCVETSSHEPDPAAYIWYNGVTAIPSAAAKVYTIDTVTVANSAGTYKCQATFATSTVTVSAEVELKVYGRERSFQKLLFKLFPFFS